MVRVGFICEGFTEFILLKSESFKQLLTEFNIEQTEVINSEGCGNLLPHNISGYLEILEKKKSNVILILTDLDDDSCFTQTKERIKAREQDIIVISAKQIEAWFLACTSAMQKLLGVANFNFKSPEQEADPFGTINNLLIHHSGRGIGKRNSGKIRLIKRLIDQGLDISEVTKHPNCPSGNYFIEKLKEIGQLQVE